MERKYIPKDINELKKLKGYERREAIRKRACYLKKKKKKI